MTLLDPAAHDQTAPEAQAQGITLRAVAIGLVVSILVSAWTTFSRTVVSTSSVNITHFPVSLLAVFMILVTCNLVLRTRFRREGLTPSELLTVLSMGLVSAMIPARGLTGIWLAIMAAPFYLSTPENGWIDYVQPHLPSHLYPTNDSGQTQYLYEGLPRNAAIPWEVWIVPLFWWITLILAGFAVCVCIVVILRKQWVEHERLDYPLIAPITDLIDSSNDNSATAHWPAMFKGWRFWIGFGLAFGIIAWNGINYFAPNWPRINMSPGGGLFYFGRVFPPWLTHINTYAIGFSYFINLEILFSIWFFRLLLITETAILNRAGVAGSGVVGWQSTGALVVFVLWGLWSARGHLRDVFRKAAGRAEEVDDTHELISYRGAVLGLIAGTFYIIGWLYNAGVSLSLIAITIPASVIIYIALARFVCESGTLYLGLSADPLGIGYTLLGTQALSGQTIAAASTSHALRWMYFMPALSQGARAADNVQGSRRKLFGALTVSLLAALGVNIALVLYLGYTHGAYNFYEYPFSRYAPGRINGIVAHISSPVPANSDWVLPFGIGGIVIAAISILRYRLPWWPIHPVGLVVANTSLHHVVTSVFIVWVVKSVIMRVGGVLLFRRLAPLFFGIIVGRATGVLLSFIVDLIWFPGGGHSVHGWS
jgi:hypothetical protein